MSGMETLLESPSIDLASRERDRIYNKMLWRIAPFVLACYLVNMVDRSNVSFAKLMFMHDVKLSEAAYGFGAGLFYIGYILLEVPSNLYLQRVGARRTLLRIMVIWGFVSALTSLVRTPYEFYAVRFVLGLAEAGFIPGVVLFLTYWFPAARRASAMSMFLMGNAIAGIISGPIAGWIMPTFQGIGGLQGWQWLFITEGVPAILLGIACFFYLHDSPAAAKWLSEREKAIVLHDLEQSRGGAMVHADLADVLKVLRDPRVYAIILTYFSMLAANNAVALWMPSMLRNIGAGDVATIGRLVSVAYVVSAISMYYVGKHSDKTGERRWHIAIPLLLAAISLTLLTVFPKNLAVSVVLFSIAAAGSLAALGCFWTIPTAYLRKNSAAGGIAVITSIGGLGGFASPALLGWAVSQSGGLAFGFMLVSFILLAGALAAIFGVPARLLGDPVKE